MYNRDVLRACPGGMGIKEQSAEKGMNPWRLCTHHMCNIAWYWNWKQPRVYSHMNGNNTQIVTGSLSDSQHHHEQFPPKLLLSSLCLHRKSIKKWSKSNINTCKSHRCRIPTGQKSVCRWFVSLLFMPLGAKRSITNDCKGRQTPKTKATPKKPPIPSRAEKWHQLRFISRTADILKTIWEHFEPELCTSHARLTETIG